MGIKAIHLDNFEQHENRRFEFSPRGVNCICGENGEGKSTLVRAIDFAFTGTFNTGEKTRKEHIRWGADKGSVFIEFDAQGLNGSIERNLHNSGVKLNWGGQEYNTVSAADPILLGLIGGQAVFSTFGILQQGKLDELLTAMPAARKSLLQTLYGLERVEAKWNALGTEQALFTQIRMPTRTPEIIEDEMRQVRARLLATELDRRQIGEEVVDRDNLLSAIDREATASRYDIPIMNFAAGMLEVEQAKKEITDGAASIQLLTEQQQELQTELATVQASVKSAQAQEQAWKSAQYALGQAKTLASRKSDLAAQKGAITAPAAVEATNARIDALKADKQQILDALSKAKAEFNQAQAAHTQFKAGTCPTCGTCEIVGLEGGKTALASLLDQYQGQMNELKSLGHKLVAESKAKDSLIVADEQAVKTHEAAVSKWKQELAAVERDMATIERDIAALPDMTSLTVLKAPETANHAHQAAEVSRLNAELNKVRTSILAIRSQDDQRKIKVSTLTAKLEQEGMRDANLLRVWNSARAAGVTSAAAAPASVWVNDVRTALASDRTARNSRTRLDVTIEEIKSQLQNTENEKQVAFEALEAAARQRRYLQILERARASTHRDAYGTAALRRSIGTINSEWNKVLSRLGQNFTIGLNADLDIEVYFGDNKCRSLSMSGGQRTAAAFAFAVAAQQIVRSPLGMFIADEPTYGLDDKRIEMLAGFMPEIQQLLASEGAQMILISHEARVRDAAEHFIQL